MVSLHMQLYMQIKHIIALMVMDLGPVLSKAGPKPIKLEHSLLVQLR